MARCTLYFVLFRIETKTKSATAKPTTQHTEMIITRSSGNLRSELVLKNSAITSDIIYNSVQHLFRAFTHVLVNEYANPASVRLAKLNFKPLTKLLAAFNMQFHFFNAAAAESL